MQSLLRFLRALLVRTQQEIFLALVRVLVLILLILPVLLLWLWEWLCELLKRRNLYPEETEEPCGRLPEAIIRRPDPAIYSQRLLQSQGLPVTWNNPDIWVTRADNPTVVEPDSYHLVEDTDYIVSVRVHNASTDAAIGVRVRLNYRPWSFNSPQLVPVETDASGNEMFRFVNVPPIPGSAIAQFRWHTPKLEPDQEHRHFCLQASLYHPMDTNTNNNMGQENTNVWTSDNPGHVRPGQEVVLEVPLFNYSRRVQAFRFEATRYEINNEGQFELQLKSTRGYARWSLSQRLSNATPVLHFGRSAAVTGITSRSNIPSLTFELQPRFVAVKTKYVGFEEIRAGILSQDHSLPRGMIITAEGQLLQEGVQIGSKQSHTIRFTIKVPDDAAPGSSIPVNLIARSENGVLQGGVTVILHIEGDQ